MKFGGSCSEAGWSPPGEELRELDAHTQGKGKTDPLLRRDQDLDYMPNPQTDEKIQTLIDINTKMETYRKDPIVHRGMYGNWAPKPTA